MLNYEYVGPRCAVGGEGHFHRPFKVMDGDNHIASGIDVTFPDGAIEIRIFDYDTNRRREIENLFNISHVREVSFSRPFD